MKKASILIMLAALLIMPVPGNSQVETLINLGLSLLGLGGGGKDPYAKAILLELKKILDKNKKELAKLARIDERTLHTGTVRDCPKRRRTDAVGIGTEGDPVCGRANQIQ